MRSITIFNISFLILIGSLSLPSCSKVKGDDSESSVSTTTPSPQVATSTAYVSGGDEWMTDLDQAYAQSIKDKKPILAKFIISDSCDMCKQLDANVFSTPMFKEWAAKNVVLMEVDLPRHKQLPQKNKEQNAAMAQYLKIYEYPTVWILNVTREEENSRFKVKPIGKVANEQTPEKFIGLLQNFIRR